MKNELTISTLPMCITMFPDENYVEFYSVPEQYNFLRYVEIKVTKWKNKTKKEVWIAQKEIQNAYRADLTRDLHSHIKSVRDDLELELFRLTKNLKKGMLSIEGMKRIKEIKECPFYKESVHLALTDSLKRFPEKFINIREGFPKSYTMYLRQIETKGVSNITTPKADLPKIIIYSINKKLPSLISQHLYLNRIPSELVKIYESFYGFWKIIF